MAEAPEKNSVKEVATRSQIIEAKTIPGNLKKIMALSLKKRNIKCIFRNKRQKFSRYQINLTSGFHINELFPFRIRLKSISPPN